MFSTGTTEQKWKATISWGGGNVERLTTFKYCTILWLLGSKHRQTKVFGSHHRIDDFGNIKNVSCYTDFCSLLLLKMNHIVFLCPELSFSYKLPIHFLIHFSFFRWVHFIFTIHSLIDYVQGRPKMASNIASSLFLICFNLFI